MKKSTVTLWTSIALLILAICLGIGVGCSDASIANSNLKKAADMFEINRRVVFINGITDTYMMTVEGRCSIYDDGNQLELTCKTGPDEYYIHFLGLSDNVFYIAEQLGPIDVDVYRHRVIFKPEAIIPNIDLETSGKGE